MEGWIKLHRKIATWQWASSPNHMTIFMQLLLRANHKTSLWRMETIAPGQILTGRKQLMDWTGLTERQVRKCLDDLESTKEIVRKRSAKYSIITIANWETYQSSDRQTSVQGPANVQQRSTSKNANNINNEKNNIINCEAFTGEQNLEEVPASDLARNILTALNLICLKAFRPTSANMKFINARINEGFKLDDFVAVIKSKQGSWSNNPEMCAYLRPSTLFGTKFDGYLQETKNTFKTNSGYRPVPTITQEDAELLRASGQI